SMSDAQKYRTKDEVAEYQKIDPIAVVKTKLIEEFKVSEDDLKAIDKKVKATIKACVDFAEESPFPEPEALYQDVYAENNMGI
ncbi:MAG: thiamine pyrophosphate-dependent enzyme, partial [Flavobacteriales bacterium]